MINLRRLFNNTFEGHKGRPGKKGGSLPRSGGGNKGKPSVTYKDIKVGAKFHVTGDPDIGSKREAITIVGTQDDDGNLVKRDPKRGDPIWIKSKEMSEEEGWVVSGEDIEGFKGTW